MKKLLSVLLVFTLVLSVAATSMLSAGATSIEETDVAATSTLSVEATTIEETDLAATSTLSVGATSTDETDLAATSLLTVGATYVEQTDLAATRPTRVFFSDKPYEEVTNDKATVYGFLGDSDGDGDVSIIDCTAIQLYLADLGSLTSNGMMVSDVDRDGDVSVMDATEIQLWKAYLSSNPNISRSVYHLPFNTNSNDDVFEIIASRIMENGEYDEETDSYSVLFSRGLNFLNVSYFRGADNIHVSSMTLGEDLAKATSSYMYIYHNESSFQFSSFEYNEDFDPVFMAKGEGQINYFSPYKISTSCTTFESITASNESPSSYEEVKQNIETHMCTALTDIDKLLLAEFPYHFGHILNSK